MIKKRLAIGGSGLIAKRNALRVVVFRVETVNIEYVAAEGVVTEVANVNVALVVVRKVLPVGVFRVGNGFCVEQFAVQVDQVELRLAAAVVVCPERIGLLSLCQTRTFRRYRRKLSYFAIFVMRFNFLKIIGSVIGLTGTEHRFDR